MKHSNSEHPLMAHTSKSSNGNLINTGVSYTSGQNTIYIMLQQNLTTKDEVGGEKLYYFCLVPVCFTTATAMICERKLSSQEKVI